MKKSALLVSFALLSTAAFSQTIFTYGNIAVSKDEFLRAYNKNKTTVTDKEKSLREYLTLYSRFKQKVRAAQELKLDTLQQLKYDLQNFSSQVEEGYLNDEKRVNELVDEAIQRNQKDIHVVHFSIPLTSKIGTIDTVESYKIAKIIQSDLIAGKTNYDELAKKNSTLGITVSGNDLGFITVFSLPYGMETLVYGMDNGAVSGLYRTKSALHIFKKLGERKNAGKWKIAQILFSIPPDASENKIASIKAMADSVYNLLQHGADFAQMAQMYSDDRLTYQNGGELAEFGTGKFLPDFETPVFQLQKDGDISAPFKTEYGFHIVRRLHQYNTPADRQDESYVYNLKQQITQDSRINTAKAQFVKDVLVKIQFKKSGLVKDEELYRLADSVTVNKNVPKTPVNNKVIFTFTNSKVVVSDWLNFVKDYKLNPDVYKGESNKELLEKYISTAALEYYRKNLARYNADFRYQLQEFKEGNMLFEIMERNVWSKAANDSVGLKQYYDAHQTKYQWNESAAIYLFSCSDKETADKAIADLKSSLDWKAIAEKSEGKIQADSGRYELQQLSLPEGETIKEGLISQPIVNAGDNTAGFFKVLRLFPANQQRTFPEARGLVINEYQNYLEEKWLETLQQQYPVKVNESVFQSLLQ